MIDFISMTIVAGYIIYLIIIFNSDEQINPYNYYRIYKCRKTGKYVAKYIKTLLFPIFVTFKENIPSGFEDYRTSIHYFNTPEEAKDWMETYYNISKNKRKNRFKSKYKRIKI